MQRPTALLPLVSLLLAGACDDAVLADAVDRGAQDPELIQLRPFGTNTSGGSTRLNTAQLFPEGMPLRHFDRDGDPVTYDDAAATEVTFQHVRVYVGGALTTFTATGNNIEPHLGALKINGVMYQAGQLLGSEWRFKIADSTHAPRYFTMRVSGVGIAEIPGGLDLPIYNFSLVPGQNYHVPGPYSACAELDALSASGVVLKQVGETPPGVANKFKVSFAAVLYPNVKVSELGTVTEDERVGFIGCASGAIGKAGLWGYPSWVSSYGGRNGVQQLQAASRVVRADICGDGVSHTDDGTPLQVRDRFFPAFDDATEASEAVWGGNGSTCVVTDDRLVSGVTNDCGGALTEDCRQLASDWITGPDQFMWTKQGPTTTTYTPSHACTVASIEPGCADPGVEAVVCAADSYCCETAWDGTCVAEVASLAAMDEACCGDNGNPGCGDATVSGCVATYDPFCEATRWDSYCALEVESLGCGYCH